MTVPAQKPVRKLSMKQRYSALTHDLDWTPTYVTEEQVFPHTTFEGIKVHDWSKWDDPFRLTVEAYNKYQAEKDRRIILQPAEGNLYTGILPDDVGGRRFVEVLGKEGDSEWRLFEEEELASGQVILLGN